MSYDTSTPALLLMIGDHTWDYGALATVRSLGRVGIPVFAALSDVSHPVTRSTYLTAALPWRTTGAEGAPELVAGIRRLCDRIGRPAVAIAGDDESAVLLAAHRGELEDVLLLPRVDPTLPGLLAGKGSLAQLCRETGTPTPATISPATRAEVEEFAATARFPLVVKNPEPFARLVDRSVPATTKVETASELFTLLGSWKPGTPLVIQEFLPQSTSQDWYVAAVLTDDHTPAVAFSGRKLRAYPDGTGVGTLSESVYDAALVRRAMAFCRRVGYAGVCDMDWRWDERDGQFKLLDFNPRRGAQFATFRSTAGVDVVRALHLVLTGRPVPPGPEIDGIRHAVGVLDQRAYLARRSRPEEPAPLHGRGTERAWWAWDDPGPGWVFARQLGPWGRLGRRAESLPTSEAWRDVVARDPAPQPFDKPGPPRPVQRWRAWIDAVDGPTEVLVAVACSEGAAQRLRHEVAARQWAVAYGIPVPPVLADGPGWTVSAMVDSRPTSGAAYVSEALAAARAIRAAPTAPPHAVSSWHRSRRDIAQRLARAMVGRLPLQEFRRVRAEAQELPTDVWVHGDFSNANVMNGGSGVEVIDWEFCGAGVLGTDEVRLWTTLDDPADRRQLMTEFLSEVPANRRRETGVLVHWLALRQLAENLAAPRRHQNPANIALGHVVLGEARRWREQLAQDPAT